ncbi:MAG: GTPase domain-containing protein [Planctomycetaceae bacterium]|jgi:GTPase SAR1 family protein|nr:GTPase domain-containing protein [Planctomycetaceae bacterium]
MKYRLFIYGSSGSGKTSFLRQLIQGNGLQVSSKQKLSKFMSGSVSSAGQVIPTTVGVDGLEIKLDRNSYVVSDWQGELLSAFVNELSDVDIGLLGSGGNKVGDQIIGSDAILFFFDPTAQSTLDSIRSFDQIQRHHCKELLRAKQLVDFVLRVRQNRFIPIIFILTHCDLVDVIPRLDERVEGWVSAVSSYLNESYNEYFGGYYPVSLVCRERLFFYVSAVGESRQPRKPHTTQTGTTPTTKVDAVSWVESFPFAVDLANIFRDIPSHIDLIRRFRRKDRRRCFGVMFLFLICFCIIFFMSMFYHTQAGQKFINGLKKQLTSMALMSDLRSLFGNDEVLDTKVLLNLQLLDDAFNFDVKNADAVNESLNVLMRQLNKLENADKQNDKDYKVNFAHWSDALRNVDRLFDVGNFESSQVKLETFSIILNKLSDSSIRITPSLDVVLRKFWGLYREVVVSDISSGLQVDRSEGLSGKQQLEKLCSRLERYFLEINNSGVRGDGFSSRSNNSVNNLRESNQKEQLKQDIRKCFKSCEGFLVGYSVEIRVKDVLYSSDVGVDRDFLWRLSISGFGGGSIYIDLGMPSGYRNEKICKFLPSKDHVTVLFNFDSQLRVSLEQKRRGVVGQVNDNGNNNLDQNQNNKQDREIDKGEIGSGWQEVFAWQIEQRPTSDSLEQLGIKFYLQFENDTNTNYTCENENAKIQLEIKRTKIIPELLWEIMKHL